MWLENLESLWYSVKARKRSSTGQSSRLITDKLRVQVLPFPLCRMICVCNKFCRYKKKKRIEVCYMTKTEARVEQLKTKVRQAESKGNGTSGVVRKWKREIRKLAV